MTQEMLFSKYAEQYPLTVPQEAVENELQLLILEEKQRIQYETLTGFAVHLSPQEELNKKNGSAAGGSPTPGKGDARPARDYGSTDVPGDTGGAGSRSCGDRPTSEYNRRGT